MTRIFILNDHFYPSYKSGGPVQSLINLVLSLAAEYDVNVITSAFEFHSNTKMPGIEPDEWINISMPGGKRNIAVWYADKNKPGFFTIRKLLKERHPDILYLNGIFSYKLFIVPLIAVKTLSKRPKIVICPRGMLQKGALNHKAIKKKSYLNLIKWLGLLNHVRWHATNEEEKNDILKNINSKADVIIALNIPKIPMSGISFIEKNSRQLRLIYLSLITEKKES